MSGKNTFARSLTVAVVLLGLAVAPAVRATTTDEIRSFAVLQRMKAMEVMHLIDADKSGYVTKEEFMKFMEAFFDRMDRNHEGKVDAKEWMGSWGARQK